jgi:membrane fusion protein (multidrug efflux system)
MTRPRHYLIGALILVLLLATIALRILTRDGASDQQRTHVTLVRVEQPQRETVTSALNFTGDVVAIQQATIFAKVGGTIEQIYVNMGTPVQAGELLALVDTTELHETLMQASATYQNTKIIFNRTRQLVDQNLASHQDLDNSEATMKVAAAAYETAVTRLSYARISAPFRGIITRRYLDPGAVVTANTVPLFTLMDLNVVKIFLNVLEADIPSIKTGEKALVTVESFPGREFAGTVTRFSQALDLATRTMAVEIDIPNRDHLLKPGMFAEVTLILNTTADAITVPTQAIIKSEQGYVVYSVQGDTARSIPVTLGSEQDARTEIRSGLTGDELVITVGQQLVKDGTPVRIQR